MKRLTPQDVKLLMRIIREIYSCLDRETLPIQSVNAISKAIPSSFITYDEIYPGEHKVVHTGIPTPFPIEVRDMFQKYMHEHPFINLFFPGEMEAHPFAKEIKKSAYTHHISSHYPEGKAVKLSDVLTRDQFHSLGLYNEAARLLDIEYQMLLPVIHRPSIGSGITFNRDRHDFTERERLILNLISPHILQAFKNSEVAFDTQMEIEKINYGLIVLKPDGEVRFWTEKARYLLMKYFKAPSHYSHQLPDELIRWVREQKSLLAMEDDIPSPLRPYIAENERGLLEIRFINSNRGEREILLIEEKPKIPFAWLLQSLGLTPREAEVLYWVCQGKTNTEIAIILNISFRTVKKHLEKIYCKLGVENRTTASIMAIEILGNKSEIAFHGKRF